MRTIKAVIYDVDGTLIDSEPLHNRAWDEALTARGSSLESLSNSFIAKMPGKKPLVIADSMVKELQLDVTAEQLLSNKTDAYLRLIKSHLRALPGAISSITRCKEQGLLLAIGTSIDRKLLDVILKQLRIAEHFDVIVTGDDVQKGKPHPEIYLTVLKKLGLSPNEAVVFEDSDSGIRAAKAAGIWCVAVSPSSERANEHPLADATISSFDEVTREYFSATISI